MNAWVILEMLDVMFVQDLCGYIICATGSRDAVSGTFLEGFCKYIRILLGREDWSSLEGSRTSPSFSQYNCHLKVETSAAP